MIWLFNGGFVSGPIALDLAGCSNTILLFVEHKTEDCSCLNIWFYILFIIHLRKSIKKSSRTNLHSATTLKHEIGILNNLKILWDVQSPEDVLNKASTVEQYNRRYFSSKAMRSNRIENGFSRNHHGGYFSLMLTKSLQGNVQLNRMLMPTRGFV